MDVSVHGMDQPAGFSVGVLAVLPDSQNPLNMYITQIQRFRR